MSETSDFLYCPPGNGEGDPIPIDMGHWAKLEQRILEIATVTPAKAPELLSTFNRAALELDRLSSNLELEHQLAVRKAERIRGRILLDEVPGILKTKGLATERSPMGSEDMRQAILSQNAEYQTALDAADMIKAMTKVIRGKYDAFERAFRSVRTLVGEATFNFSNPNLKGNTGTAAPGAHAPPPGFGVAKF